MGAAFPTDALQLLPASSPSPWIILLCRVCDYPCVISLPGALEQMGGCLSCQSHQLGAWGSRDAKGMQWGQQRWLCSEGRKWSPREGISREKPLPCSKGKDKDAVAGWEEEWVWMRDMEG